MQNPIAVAIAIFWNSVIRKIKSFYKIEQRNEIFTVIYLSICTRSNTNLCAGVCKIINRFHSAVICYMVDVKLTHLKIIIIFKKRKLQNV